MHIFYINILTFNFGVFYMFRIRGFIVRKTVVYTVMLWYVSHVSVQAVSITFFYLQDCLCWYTYHTGIHNRLPEDEPSASKHVEDFRIKNWGINVENVHFVYIAIKIVAIKIFIYVFVVLVIKNVNDPATGPVWVEI